MLFSKKKPSKHSSWWRLTEDVLKTSWIHLQRNIFLSLKTSWRHNCKTSSLGRLEDVLKTSWWKHLTDTSWRHLEDVLKTSWKTSWRHLGNVLKTSCEDVLKTSWRCLEDVFGRGLTNTSWTLLEDEKLLCCRRLG